MSSPSAGPDRTFSCPWGSSPGNYRPPPGHPCENRGTPPIPRECREGRDGADQGPDRTGLAAHGGPGAVAALPADQGDSQVQGLHHQGRGGPAVGPGVLGEPDPDHGRPPGQAGGRQRAGGRPHPGLGALGGRPPREQRHRGGAAARARRRGRPGPVDRRGTAGPLPRPPLLRRRHLGPEPHGARPHQPHRRPRPDPGTAGPGRHDPGLRLRDLARARPARGDRRGGRERGGRVVHGTVRTPAGRRRVPGPAELNRPGGAEPERSEPDRDGRLRRPRRR
ncbi:hypothetical protein SGPA1_31049 [Streptomyces misionensis JCM 4497]